MLPILFVILIVFQLVSSDALDCLCGRQSGKTRIVNGRPVGQGKFPWIVALATKKSDGSFFQFCGGTLINDQWILTAAHCVPDISASSLYILKEQVNIEDVKPANVLTVDRIWSHPGYKGAENGHHDDIALLKLSNPVTFTGSFSPVCLPSADMKNFDNLFNIGWGRVGVVDNPSSKLLYIETKQYHHCENIYSGLKFWSKQICSYNNGNGICQGDSGGPLSTRKNGYVTQVGVNSWVIAGTCGSFPDVTTRVSEYLNDIQEITAGSKWCRNPNLGQ